MALAFAAVIASVYVVIWSVIVSIFAGVVSLGLGGAYLFILAFTLFGYGFANVILTLGVGIGLMGLCLLGFLAAKTISVELIHLTKWLFIQVKNLFIKKPAKPEDAKQEVE